MKVINGTTYLTIGEVAKRIGRRTQTIKNWYEWVAQNEDKVEHPLPEVFQNLDSRCTRFFREDDLEMLVNFRDNIQYGQLADVNRTKWGERGKDIIEKEQIIEKSLEE